MKFFVDTADTAEISDLAATGLLDGVTTNPTLLAKENKPFREALIEMCSLVDIVNGEVVATDAGSVRDFAAFAKQTGNELVSQETVGDEFVHVLKRR